MSDGEQPDFLPRTPWQRVWDPPPEAGATWLTRFVMLRLLGLVYFVAFFTAVMHADALIGSDGLLPAHLYLDAAADHFGSRAAGFLERPGLFWITGADWFLSLVSWLGALLSLAVLFGYANSIILFVLWFLYMSIVHVGQDWYSFGWETQLLDTGLLAVFLVPLIDGRPFPRTAPPRLVIVLFRWMIVRIMLGAGMIKMRGDPCWEELTCLVHHYETQPIPNPMASMLHNMPLWFHELGAVFNHFCELIVPFFVFGPKLARRVAGVVLIVFQLSLIASGNLSFLNWLTIAPALACLDDGVLKRILPRRLVAARDRAVDRARSPARAHRVAIAVLFCVQAVLSLWVIDNLLSSDQKMNYSFNRLHIMNTYGAFGGVGRERPEIVFQGTDAAVIDKDTEWRDYEFPCKPGDTGRRPCLITPYHYRLDWLLWFAAMSSADEYPWTVHMVWKLLHGNETLLGIMANNPFSRGPPRYVRIVLYNYRLAGRGDAEWWDREPLGEWLPPLSVDDPRLIQFVRARGWAETGGYGRDVQD